MKKALQIFLLLILLLTAAALITGVMQPTRSELVEATATPLLTTDDFCAQVQKDLSLTRLQARNVVYTDFDAFVDSKPTAEPLETRQFVRYEDAARTRPMLISCKTKSGDKLNAVVGAGSADDAVGSCRAINRRTVNGVYAGLSAEERTKVKFPPDRIILDPDDIRVVGPAWVSDYAFAYAGDDGSPHFQAKSLVSRWDDWRWKFMPEEFRGTHYCHLIAPEYARRVMLGEVSLPLKGAN